MQIKSILAGAAIALAATMGSASAGEMLTLSAIPAEPLTAAEMEQVQGKWSLFVERSTKLSGFRPGGDDHHPIPGPGSSNEVDDHSAAIVLAAP